MEKFMLTIYLEIYAIEDQAFTVEYFLATKLELKSQTPILQAYTSLLNQFIADSIIPSMEGKRVITTIA